MLLMIEGNEEKFGFVECLYWNLIGLCCFANGFAKRLLFDQRLEMHFVSDRSDPKTGICVIWMEIQNFFKLVRSFQRLCINQVSKTGKVNWILLTNDIKFIDEIFLYYRKSNGIWSTTKYKRPIEICYLAKLIFDAYIFWKKCSSMDHCRMGHSNKVLWKFYTILHLNTDPCSLIRNFLMRVQD